MTSAKKLQAIALQIENCAACRCDKTGKAVPGEGSATAKIVFIGEAPGRKEAETGRPFIGRSGTLLRSLIQNAGLTEGEVFITSPVKYLPIYRTPKPADIAHGKIHLDAQLAVIAPKIVVLLGAVAQRALLDETFPVLKARGKIVKKDGVSYFITLHPAAALRFPPLKKLLEEDFELLRKLL